MIQLSGAGKRFGHKLLFENVDWVITNRDHIGLVGGNGTGKSTLMKVLAGMDTFDYGSLVVAKGTSAGYLPQDGLTLSGRTVFAECMSVFDDVRAMEQELESLMHSMAELDHTAPSMRQWQIATSAWSMNSAPATDFDRSRRVTRADGAGLRQRRLAAADR